MSLGPASATRFCSDVECFLLLPSVLSNVVLAFNVVDASGWRLTTMPPNIILKFIE
jgi:hypothetical protein